MSQSIKQLAETRLYKYPTLSLKEDILGWYGVNPELTQRSVGDMLYWLGARPFLRVAIVIFEGAYRCYWGEVYNSPRFRPAIEVFQKDVDFANQIWKQANISIYIQALKIVDPGADTSVLSMSGWSSRALWASHRELGANVNCYYINNNADYNRGLSNKSSVYGYSPVFGAFWVGCNAPDHIFAHEVGHALELDDNNSTYDEVGKIDANLMNTGGLSGREFTASPLPLLTGAQIQTAINSRWMEWVEG